MDETNQSPSNVKNVVPPACHNILAGGGGGEHVRKSRMFFSEQTFPIQAPPTYRFNHIIINGRGVVVVVVARGISILLR
jgi:hypothetical protein